MSVYTDSNCTAALFEERKVKIHFKYLHFVLEEREKKRKKKKEKKRKKKEKKKDKLMLQL